MRLVVHLGAPRAASGFLQRCLARNERPLGRHGVFLPLTGRLDPSYDIVTHHNLGWELLGDPSFREDGGTWNDLETELRSADADTALLTSETFGRLATDPGLRTEFLERLSALSQDVTLLYVVRDPLERINSMYKQLVRGFGTPFGFDDYAAASIRSGYYDLDESFSFWYGAENVQFNVLRFDEMVAAGPFESLLTALDVTLARKKLPNTADHVSPGPVAIEAMRALNVHLRIIDPGFSRRSAAGTRLAEIAERRAATLGWSTEPYWGWASEQAEWAAGRLSAGNEAFARAVWGTDWPLPPATDHPQQTVNLIAADRKVYNDALVYVANLTHRYLKQAAPVEEGQPVGDVVDPSTVVTDEAERAAAAAPTRKQPSRAAGSPLY